ncbi:MAG: hypothetical protein GY861_18260 [bacterium]|nr:hypothetical protein [bacterium]
MNEDTKATRQCENCDSSFSPINSKTKYCDDCKDKMKVIRRERRRDRKREAVNPVDTTADNVNPTIIDTTVESTV